MSLAMQNFTAAPTSVGAARRFAVAVLMAWGLDALSEDVRSVVSELATNAEVHARTSFAVSLELRPSVSDDLSLLRVGVTDASRGRPRPARHGAPDATTGRGLRMIEELSRQWGVEREANGGKTVWCEFAVSGPVSAAPEVAVSLSSLSSPVPQPAACRPSMAARRATPAGRVRLLVGHR